MMIDYFKKFSTRSKLIFIYILSVMIITISLLLIFNFLGKNIFRNQVQSQLSALASSKSVQVLSIIEQDMERTNLIASRTQMRLSLLEIERYPDSIDQNRDLLINILNDASKSVSAIRAIDLLNTKGVIIASTISENIGRNDLYNITFFNALKSSYQGDFDRDELGNQYYTISIPLLNPDSSFPETIGVVRVEFSIIRLLAVLEDYTGLGKTGEILLFSYENGYVSLLN